MPTTFLNLTNELLRRINEVPIDSGDFSGVRGVQAVAKDVINRSIEGINQDEFEWPFNIGVGSQVLTIGTEDYNWPSTTQIPKWESFHISRDDALNVRGKPLQFIPREEWLKYQKTDDDYAGSDGLGMPAAVFERHGFGFSVSPSPDEAYTVTWEYFINPVILVAHGDTPTIPSIWDEVIIQGALWHFYMFRDNTEEANMTELRYKKRLARMRTILINKDTHVYSTMLPSSNYFGQYAERLYPL